MSAPTLTPILDATATAMIPKSVAAELRPAVDWTRVEIVDSRLLPPNDWTPQPEERELSPTLRIAGSALSDENGAWVCPNCHEGESFCGCIYQPPREPEVRKPGTLRTPEEIARDTQRAGRTAEQIVRECPVNAHLAGAA